MTRVAELHRKWLKDPAYKAAYDELDPEFAKAAKSMSARPDSLPSGRVATASSFVIFREQSGAFAWRMISKAGEVEASASGFASRDAARRAITQFKMRTSRATVTDLAPRQKAKSG